MTLSVVLRIAGGVMILIGAIWGRVGSYTSQAPALAVLVLGGAAAFFVGQTIRDRSQP
jgi:hypothetical protein